MSASHTALAPLAALVPGAFPEPPTLPAPTTLPAHPTLAAALTTGTTPYLLALSVITGLGAVALAGDLYARVFWRFRARVLDLYAAGLTLAVLIGAPVTGLAGPGGTGPVTLLLCLPVGVAVGLLAHSADRAVIRAFARRAPRQTVRMPTADTARPVRIRPAGGSLLLGGTTRRSAGGHRGPDSGTPADTSQFPLASVIAVAVAEELFYRGVLLRAALLAPGGFAAALVAATLVAFVLSHVTFGWRHVAAKAPLGVGATAAALALAGPAAAVLAHVVFNVLVWRAIRAGTGDPVR